MCVFSSLCFGSLSFQFLVNLIEPAKTWFVDAAQAVVEVDKRVVILNVLVQSELQVPAKETKKRKQEWKHNVKRNVFVGMYCM